MGTIKLREKSNQLNLEIFFVEPMDRVVSLILNYLQIKPNAKEYIYNLVQCSSRGEYGVNLGYGSITSHFFPTDSYDFFLFL